MNKHIVPKKSSNAQIKIYRITLATLIWLLVAGLFGFGLGFSLFGFLSLGARFGISIAIFLILVIGVIPNKTHNCRNIVYFGRLIKHWMRSNSFKNQIKAPEMWNPYEKIVDQYTLQTKYLIDNQIPIYGNQTKTRSYVRVFSVRGFDPTMKSSVEYEQLIGAYGRFFHLSKIPFSIIKIYEKNNYEPIIASYQAKMRSLQAQQKNDLTLPKKINTLKLQIAKFEEFNLNNPHAYKNNYYFFIYSPSLQELNEQENYFRNNLLSCGLIVTKLSAINMVQKILKIITPFKEVSVATISNYAENLDGVLAPKTIINMKNKVKVDDLYLNFLTINSFPNYLSELWGVSFVSNEATVIWNFYTEDLEQQKKNISKQAVNARINEGSNYKEYQRYQSEHERAVYSELLDRITAGGESIKKMSGVIISYGNE